MLAFAMLASQSWTGVPGAEQRTFDELLPLTLGNRWEYRKTVETPGQLPQVTPTFSRVRGAYLCNGELWHHYEEDGVCFWVNNRVGGQYEGEISVDEETSGLQVDRDFLVFRWPVQADEQWEYHVDLTSDEDPIEVRCVELKKLVVAPAGRFRCVWYEMVDDYVVSSFFFAPGVGLVLGEWHDKETREASRIELSKFIPADAAGAPSIDDDRRQ
ncbi:MAG: hypothetical protein AAF961_14585 [Planctomycetota bacterium]